MGNTFFVVFTAEKAMPWDVFTVEKKREEFVILAHSTRANMSLLCRRFEISRNTGYKWLARTVSNPDKPLSDHSTHRRCRADAFV
jgi:transposase-like protein